LFANLFVVLLNQPSHEINDFGRIDGAAMIMAMTTANLRRPDPIVILILIARFLNQNSGLRAQRMAAVISIASSS
jgi:hypothetical protein